jgi:hypothetical protein
VFVFCVLKNEFVLMLCYIVNELLFRMQLNQIVPFGYSVPALLEGCLILFYPTGTKVAVPNSLLDTIHMCLLLKA